MQNSEPDHSPSDSLIEPMPQWYRRTGGCFFGNMYVHGVFSILHVLICLAPLGSALIWAGELVAWLQGYPWVALLWLAVVALGYPTWAWIETMVFEKWVRTLSEPQRKTERAHYQLHVGMAKNFWQAVMQMYTVASFIGIALKSTGKF